MKKIIIVFFQLFSKNIQVKGFPKFILLIKNFIFEHDTIYSVYNNVDLKIFPSVGFHCLNVLNYGGFDTIKLFEKYLHFGDTFIDVGANLGYMSINASRIVGKTGKVLSFEPDCSVNNLLDENIRINNVNNILVNRVALSNFVGKAFFNIATESGLSRLDNENKNFKGLDLCARVEVPVNTLDNILAEYEYQDLKVKMVKIDVEGHELSILKGAINVIKKFSPLLILEINPGALIENNLSLSVIVKYLLSVNYSSFYINSHSADLLRFSRKPSLELITLKNLDSYYSKNFDLLATPNL